MTYEQALRFWYGRINYEQRSPNPSDLKLDRMRLLLERLGNPHERLRIVHVAGSKGKGSTSAMLANCLRQAGYRTGLFTSPHLCSVEERIQVDGVPITAHELAPLMDDVRAGVEAVDAHKESDSEGVTFFEVATALGFLHFVRRRAQVAVVEVGLGGRFDSTNVCTPLISIITSISYDHTQQLGNTLTSIAREKAGIVKPGRPVISGARAPDARAVIERICRERAAPLQQLDVDFHYRYVPGQVSAHTERLPRVQIVTRRRTWPMMELGLLGEHQAANAALAVAAVEKLNDAGLAIPETQVAAGLAQVQWPARLEVVSRRPLVVLDCAHNLASIEALLDTLAVSFTDTHLNGSGSRNGSTPSRRRLLIFACSNDKDLAGMLRLLAPRFCHIYLTRFGTNSRSAAPKQLGELLRRCAATPFTLCPASTDAWRTATAAAGSDDLICVTGSVFLAGELRALMVNSMGAP